MAGRGARWLSSAAVAMVTIGCVAAPTTLVAWADPSAAPSSSAPAPVNPGARPAILTMYVTQSGSDLLAQGTLRGSDNKPLSEQVTLLVDGQGKANATPDPTGNWQTSVSLNDIADGTHLVAASYAGAGSNGPAQVQVQMTTRKPLKPSVLTGSLSTGVAGPGDEITAQGTLTSDNQPIQNGVIQLQLRGATVSAQTDGSGNYSVKASVPKDAQVGTTLTAVLTYPGDVNHPGATLNLPVMVQKVASPSPTPTPTPTPTSPSASVTPGTLADDTPSAAPAPAKQAEPGISVLPFVIVVILAVGAAGALGYLLYRHRDSDIFRGFGGGE